MVEILEKFRETTDIYKVRYKGNTATISSGTKFKKEVVTLNSRFGRQTGFINVDSATSAFRGMVDDLLSKVQ